MELAEEVGVIERNRRGKRGGGVAVSYNKLTASLKEYKFPGNKFEMLCAVGNSIHSNRKVALVAVYIPPNQKHDITVKLGECLVDGINKFKCDYDDPIIIVGGDTNNRSLEHLLADIACLLYTSPSPRDLSTSRMPSSA